MEEFIHLKVPQKVGNIQGGSELGAGGQVLVHFWDWQILLFEREINMLKLSLGGDVCPFLPFLFPFHFCLPSIIHDFSSENQSFCFRALFTGGRYCACLHVLSTEKVWNFCKENHL